MNKLKTDRINQHLRELKQQRQKVNKYRNKRIHSKYNKIKQQQQQYQKQGQGQMLGKNKNWAQRSGHQVSVGDVRKIQFYNQVFGATGENQVKEGRKWQKERRIRGDSNQNTNKQENRDVQQCNEPMQKQQQISNSQIIAQKQPILTPQHGQSVEKKHHSPHNQPHRKNIKKSQGKRQHKEYQKMQMKAEKLKNRKKKFIKKLNERTNRGQPVMKNYVKYALTKIQETLVKEKMGQMSKSNDNSTKKFGQFEGNKNNKFKNYGGQGKMFKKKHFQK